MIHPLNVLLTVVAAVLLLPTAVFCVQCLAALLPARRHRACAACSRPSVVVLMPAHNESAGIAAAIISIKPQLHESDRLVVVADNCTDGTEDIAKALGAEVVERKNVTERGKGFALDFGINHLANNPPQIVIILDSDCKADPAMVETLARQVVATNRPAQAVYLLSSPANPQPRDAVSALAFLVKNLVRPRGLARMGLPCMLTGTGMAFPWPLLRQATLASSNIVEDLQLSIDLTLAGHAPLLCPQAKVTGELPRQGKAARAQRTRWEHGYLQTAISWLPRLLTQGLRKVDREVLSVAFDLTVPPLALLVLIIALATLTGSAAALAGLGWRVPVMLAAGLSGVGLCVLSAWARFGRDSLPAAALLGTPLYIAGKLPIYFDFVFRRETRWIRTERDDDDQNLPLPRPQQPPERLPTILMQGVRFNAITERRCIEHVLEALQNDRGGMLVTPNLDHLNRCRVDPSYARLIAAADIVVADGMPLVWASRLQRTPLPERVAGSDLISSLSDAAARQGRSIFLLGGAPGAAEGAATILAARYPGLAVSGVCCPEFGFDLNPEAIAELIDRLTAAKPDIVFVGLGSPKQERLIHELREWLPKTWWLGVGYSFSFIAGDGRRAPLWMRRAGLEWLHRLACEPRRLARRYLIDGLPFAARLLSGAIWSGLTGRARDQARARPSLPQEKTLEPSVTPTPSLTRDQVATLVNRSFLAGLNGEWRRPPRSPLSLRMPSVPRISDLKNLKAFVLLGGSLRPTPFRAGIRRSILDMPVADGTRLLLHWQHEAMALAKAYDLETMAIRVLVNREGYLPASAKTLDGCSVSIERDAGEFRGTGGVLRDLAGEYADDDLLLVANAGQLLTQSLDDMTNQLCQTEADVSFVAHQDGTPSGLMLVRCRALRSIAARGYVDMKEQALPAIARRFKVTHIDHRRPTGLPLHSVSDYLSAVRWWHQHRPHLVSADAGSIALANARHRDTPAHFTIVEPGATVEPGAHIRDSVVLRGARVCSGAVVVRSVVCAGGVIDSDGSAVDELVSTASRRQSLRKILHVAPIA